MCDSAWLKAMKGPWGGGQSHFAITKERIGNCWRVDTRRLSSMLGKFPVLGGLDDERLHRKDASRGYS